MAFTQKKFLNLSKENKIKKTLFALREFLEGKEKKEYSLNLLRWLIQSESVDLKIPNTQTEFEILSQTLLQLLGQENPLLEKIPFDNPGKERQVLPFKILLDNIRSPFNVGSVFRTSEAFGVQEILLCGITPSPNNNPKVLKTAKSSEIPYQSYPDSLKKTLLLKEQNNFIYCVEKTDHSVPIGKYQFQFPCVLILGNEEFGISREILQISDQVLHIPMLGQKNSLNVSVAAGIALYQASRSYDLI